MFECRFVPSDPTSGPVACSHPECAPTEELHEEGLIEKVRQELLTERNVHLNALQECDLSLAMLRDHVAGNHQGRSLLSCPVCE